MASLDSHLERALAKDESFTLCKVFHVGTQVGPQLEVNTAQEEVRTTLCTKTEPKLFFAHVRRDWHLKKHIIDLKDNEDKTFFQLSK